MAEAFLKKYGSENFEVESAGLEPRKLNSNVDEVMKAKGIDISQHETKSVSDLFRKDSLFNAVITVCDEASAERCPFFPGMIKRIPWSFTDPSSFTETRPEIVEKTAKVRDEIKKRYYSLSWKQKSYHSGYKLVTIKNIRCKHLKMT
jgi:arsenate reductase